MNKSQVLLCACLLGSSSQVFAQLIARPSTGTAVDASAGNDTLQLYYDTPAPMRDVPSDLDYGLLLSKERDVIASAAFMIHSAIQPLPRLSLRVGPQAYLAKLDSGNTDLLALAAGASASFDLIRSLGIVVFGDAFYAPGVLLFGDANRMSDFSAGASVRFAPRLYGTAGYRWLRFSLTKAPSERVQNELFVGLRWVPNGGGP